MEFLIAGFIHGEGDSLAPFHKQCLDYIVTEVGGCQGRLMLVVKDGVSQTRLRPLLSDSVFLSSAEKELGKEAT